MSALKNNKINSLARVLRNESSVEFTHNSLFYEVFESITDSGYVINVYSSNEKTNNEYIEANLLDGGLCSGTAFEAISFML